MLQAGVTFTLVRLSSFDEEGDMRLVNGTVSVVLPHLAYVVRRGASEPSEFCRMWWGMLGHEVS